MRIFRAITAAMLIAVPVLLHGQSLPVYSYSVPMPPSATTGYAPNGNLLSYTDSINGTYSNITYDSLNRLINATTSVGNEPYYCWSYDSFGNRTSQASSNQTFQSGGEECSSRVSGTLLSNVWAHYDAGNHITQSALSSAMTCPSNSVTPTSGTSGYCYDAAGNIVGDGTHQYLFDAENRVCAMHNLSSGQTVQYIYDAEGHRVAKGHPATSSSTLYCPTGAGDFTADETYVVGQNGEQVSEMDGTGQWKHTNVFAGGQLVATYSQDGSQQALHFNITDPLGTKRVQTTSSGVAELNCLSLPFGDGPPCIGATEHFFTGKERDTESGNDYFGARYYASSMGRWMSPDIPFADQNPENPQSWNLYGYVRNNPLNSIDTNGRVTWLIGGTWHNPKDWTASSPLGQEMSEFFDPNDNDVETIEWSGGNSASARAELSAKIAAAMASHSWQPGEQNNIVCHSHGCNGVMGALPILMTDGFFVNNLVSLGQPMRGDYPYSGGVDTWYNVYAGNDLVQKLGGRVPLFGGRKNSNANNLQVQTGKNPIGAHGALHNDSLTRMQWEMFIRGAQQQNDPGGSGKQNCVDNTCHGIVP